MSDIIHMLKTQLPLNNIGPCLAHILRMSRLIGYEEEKSTTRIKGGSNMSK